MAVIGIWLGPSALSFLASYSHFQHKFLNSISLTRVLTSSVILLFAHKIFKIYLLNQMISTAPLVLIWLHVRGTPSSKKKRRDSGRNVWYSFMQYFHLNFFPIQQSKLRRVWQDLSGQEGLRIYAPNRDMPFRKVIKQIRSKLGSKAQQFQLQLFSLSSELCEI